MQLRPYQADAVSAVYRYLSEQDGNPCVVIPTGGGKTPVMASIIKDVFRWGGRVLVLAHRKELLEQTYDKIKRVDPTIDVGIYSASLNSRQTKQKVICGQIQSVYKRAFELGDFAMILVDEAHLIPPSGEGMYQTFLSEAQIANPKVRVVGLTATPYRMSSGFLCGEHHILSDVCYEVGVLELIQQGYLCPLKSKLGQKVDTSKLHQRNGEFIASEASDLMMSIVNTSVHDLIVRTADRKSIIVFCQGVEHAEIVTGILKDHDNRTELITGQTMSTLRKLYLNQFQRGELKYLVNVDVLTTGFDATNIDAVALMRPTLSAGLYYQMVGRGLRINPEKENCLVLDYGANIERHGPIDAIYIEGHRGHEGKKDFDIEEANNQKVCPQCQTFIDKCFESCPECQHSFKQEFKVKHDTQAAEVDIISDGEPEIETLSVFDVSYSVHTKKDAPPDHPKTLKVTYKCGKKTEWVDGQQLETYSCPDCDFGGVVRSVKVENKGPHEWEAKCDCGKYIQWLSASGGNLNSKTISEWVCIEHEGFAGSKARHWWSMRSRDAFPESAERGVDIAEAGGLAIPVSVTTEKKPGEKYAQIKEVEVGEVPEPPEKIEDEVTDWNTSLVEQWSRIDTDEVPF